MQLRSASRPRSRSASASPATRSTTTSSRLFFEALAPAELDVYDRVMASLSEEREQVRRARRQQLERLRYQARLAERQFQKADPDNRLVAAELETRWETALRELKQAEEAIWNESNVNIVQLDQLDPETRRVLAEAGRQIPEWWRADRFSQEQKKALLRCLIDKVVVHRTAPDAVHCRVVWKGGETTDADVAITVGSWSRLSGGREIEESILELARQGRTDEEIARCLTDRGHHSPRHTTVLPSSVRIVRLRHRLLRDRRQSHPRQIPGFLTVPQLTAKLGSRAELDLRPHPQRHDPGRARRRTKAVSVPGHPRDARPVPATPGGEAQLLAFLGGHQDAISKHFSMSPSMNHFAPRQRSRSRRGRGGSRARAGSRS